MIDRVDLDAYLARVVHRFGSHEAHAIFARFMCRCLMLVEHMLPDVGRRALEVAKGFWLDGLRHSDSLLSARLDCWGYLDAKGHSIDVRDQEDAAIRALLCVLYAEPESDDFSTEAVRWFASMFDRLGDYSNETARLMEGNCSAR
jgi:hypothetical protein